MNLKGGKKWIQTYTILFLQPYNKNKFSLHELAFLVWSSSNNWHYYAVYTIAVPITTETIPVNPMLFIPILYIVCINWMMSHADDIYLRKYSAFVYHIG